MPNLRNLASPTADAVSFSSQGNRKDLAESVRPILQALARVIVTDRRAVALANQKGEILLANLSARRLSIAQDSLTTRFDWADLCARARRGGSITAAWHEGDQSFDGEVVHVPLGSAEGFMLRLAESDQESTWLRNRARAAMLMRVAHDLRTPIQSLLAAANALTRSAADGIRPATDPGIKHAAELALDHISNVLAVIRGEQNLKGGQPDEDFRIVEEVASLVAMVQPIATARASEVTLTVDAPGDLTLHGPIRYVRALCQNLIDNSVNHGGGRVDLHLTCGPLGSALPAEEAEGDLWRVKLELRDEGGGMPPIQRSRLSEALGLPTDDPGPPLSSGDKRPSAGLNVLAHALRQLGGRISIEDRGRDGGAIEPGRENRVIGTIFTVTFSLPRVATRPAEMVARDHDLGQTPLAGRSVLLVEDSPSSRDWLTHVLRGAGAEAIPVGSGPEALALLSRHEYAGRVDLVLTDVTLPRMNGIELAARLRAGDPASAVTWNGQVVGLTAHADDRIRKACMEVGMACVLEKPIQPNTLSRSLASVLDGRPLKVVAAILNSTTEVVLNPVVTADLCAQIGFDQTRFFMLRALSEARSVLDDLLAEGVGPDTGRRLHAATGASGLTGLQLVEKRLRAIELSVKHENSVPAPLCDSLADALGHTLRRIEEMAE
ncbi:MAG: response regulator [Roseovarius sp.]|nr:response regulator [Roseovarius sp.]